MEEQGYSCLSDEGAGSRAIKLLPWMGPAEADHSNFTKAVNQCLVLVQMYRDRVQPI